MDGTRFDAVARRLSSASSRRGAMKTLAVAGLGLGMTRLGWGDVAAQGKSVIKRCKKSSECKGSLKCRKSNSQNSCYDTTEKRCCKVKGEKCDDGCECCGVDVICNGGYCQGA